jgi:S-layer homology domain.
MLNKVFKSNSKNSEKGVRKVKKGLVFLTLIVFVVSAFSLGFTDVGLDNWAYDYVMKLVEKGVIPVDQPTFKGYEPLTRSDAAVWMSRLITYLENSPEIAKTKDLEYLESKVTDLSKKCPL